MEKRTGFTLIELLVVVAIISVLIALLLPAMSSARETAKTVVCASNFSQYDKAIIMYDADYNQIPFFGFETQWPAVSTTLYWCDMLEGYVSQNTNIRICPTGKAQIGANYGTYLPLEGMKHPNAPFFYGKIINGGTVHEGGKLSLSQVPNPSKYLLLLDTAYPSWIGFIYSPVNWRLFLDLDQDGICDSYQNDIQWIYNGAAPKVHRNGCNVAMADGHVEWVSFPKLFENKYGLVKNPCWFWEMGQ